MFDASLPLQLWTVVRIDLGWLSVCLVQDLASSDQDVVVAALRRCSQCSLSREGLRAVSKLLKDPRGKVSALASAALRSVAKRPRLRVQVRDHRIVAFLLIELLFCTFGDGFHSMQMSPQALVNCLELLEDDNTDVRVCGCKALACIKVRSHGDHPLPSIAAFNTHITLAT